MAEDRSNSVGSMLLGQTIPLMQAELILYNTFNRVKARLEQQQSKGI